MNPSRCTFLLVGASVVAMCLIGMGAGARANDTPAGQTAFLEAKCNVCHAVTAVGIEAKTKSEKMRGPDLGGPFPEGVTFEEVAAYLRQQAERDGAEHKKAFKGTDEELRSMFGWLESLEPTTPEP